MNGVRRAVTAINAALSTNSRKPLRAHDFIPTSVEEMDRARGEFARIVFGSMSEAKTRMPTEATRRFLDAPPVVEAFNQAMAGFLAATPESERLNALDCAGQTLVCTFADEADARDFAETVLSQGMEVSDLTYHEVDTDKPYATGPELLKAGLTDAANALMREKLEMAEPTGFVM